jgi:hypothetical protein
MIADARRARALPAEIEAGSGLLTFGLPEPGEVDRTFELSGNEVSWNNANFTNGDAIFAINPTTQLLEVFYNDLPPSTYQTIILRPALGETVAEACAALAGSTTSTSTTPLATAPTSSVPVPTTSTAPGPVGIELIVYVIIQTVVVGGETICRTEAGRTSTNHIYPSAVPGYPCYACLMASQDIECPADDKKKFTIVTSSCTETNSALYTAKPSPVYMPCHTCQATTLSGAAITPGAAVGPNLEGFSPARTVTIGGGELIYGSKSVDGKVVSTALAVPAAAPIPAGSLPAPPPAKPAEGAKPVEVDYTNASPNTNPVQVDSPSRPPAQVDAPAPGKPPVDVNSKSAAAPTGAPQPAKPVQVNSAPSFVKCLTWLHSFLLLVFII